VLELWCHVPCLLQVKIGVFGFADQLAPGMNSMLIIQHMSNAALSMCLKSWHHVQASKETHLFLFRCVAQVKIGDFGFAKQLAPGMGSMQVKRITHPRWVAPEVRSLLPKCSCSVLLFQRWTAMNISAVVLARHMASSYSPGV
jgi:serine/threonine protein kinase